MVVMKNIKKLLLAIGATFLVLTVLSGTVHAEEIPLSEKQQLIEQQAEVIEQKTTLLVTTSQEIASLEDRKMTLLEQLENENKTVEELKKKVEEKREAAEREKKRLEELRNMFVHISGYAGDSAGNTYTPGNCTWYAKSRRADIPNSLGNANTWYSRAAALGWNVGLTPKKGAVATTTAGWAGHVAYVEGVSLDGIWVTISEMNYQGLYIVSSRTVHYTEFQYIYELN
jgi:peptidoglycan DL-endopeptidase CwlO